MSMEQSKVFIGFSSESLAYCKRNKAQTFEAIRSAHLGAASFGSYQRRVRYPKGVRRWIKKISFKASRNA